MAKANTEAIAHHIYSHKTHYKHTSALRITASRVLNYPTRDKRYTIGTDTESKRRYSPPCMIPDERISTTRFISTHSLMNVYVGRAVHSSLTAFLSPTLIFETTWFRSGTKVQRSYARFDGASLQLVIGLAIAPNVHLMKRIDNEHLHT